MDGRMKPSEIAPFALRLQAELRQRIQASAEANGRSLNSEIVALLDQRAATVISSGKGLRDEFAMVSLGGILASDLLPTMIQTSRNAGVGLEAYVASTAYEMADAMLAARHKGGA